MPSIDNCLSLVLRLWECYYSSSASEELRHKAQILVNFNCQMEMEWVFLVSSGIILNMEAAIFYTNLNMLHLLKNGVVCGKQLLWKEIFCCSVSTFSV